MKTDIPTPIRSVTKTEELAIRSMPGSETESILRATLACSESGILLTSLDQQVIAVNRRFGDLFGLEPSRIIQLDYEQLQSLIRGSWMARDRADEIEILKPNRVIARVEISPIVDREGDLLGSLHTYRDVTRECRQRQIHEILIRISSEFIPNPDASMRRIMREIAAFYDDAPTILSLLDKDFMNFRMVENAPPPLAAVPGNNLDAAYCQYVFQRSAPLIIQDAGLIEGANCLPAALGGYTRYLGAPIYGEASEPIGTLCIMDQRSDELLDDLDVHFMSLAAVQVSSELARERHFEQRLTEQKAQIAQQKRDLSNVIHVLESMHAACDLLWPTADFETLLQKQAQLLCGMVGYVGAALAIRRVGEKQFKGFAIESCFCQASPFAIDDAGFDYASALSIAELGPDHALSRSLGAQSVAYAMRTEEGVGEILVAFGGPSSALGDERSEVLLKSLSDQIALLLGTHILQSDLLQTNQKLDEAQDQLLRKEKLAVVGTLAATTAHDIRNILASLTLLLAPGTSPDELSIAAVREQIGRFDVLAHRLLSYAKPRLVARQPIDLAKLLDSVFSITAGQFRVHEIKFQAQIPVDLPSVAGDPHEYEHLFVNLILNGVQAMARGGTLSVDAINKGELVEVRVSDTGTGIPDQIKDRVFEPFASSRSDGFGLGLYSCKRIVDSHGGSIEAGSNENQGATFTVHLPIY